jgi:hypothetical protein
LKICGGITDSRQNGKIRKVHAGEVGLFFVSKIFRRHYPIFFSEQNRICFIHRLSKACPIIDLVLVLLDGGSWDLGASYELINNVIINTLKKSREDRTDRLLVAINQCDMAILSKKDEYAVMIGYRPFERVRSYAV